MQELELKFSSFDAKIQHKINHVQSLYTDQQRLLIEHFDSIEVLNIGFTDNYSKELNNLRERF